MKLKLLIFATTFSLIANCIFQTSSMAQTIAIACGVGHSLAICNNNSVWAWGYGSNGQIGNGTTLMFNPTPVQVTGLSVIAVAAGEEHSLALKNDGKVWAWGSNYLGQLGNGTNTDNSIPVQVNGLTGIIAIAAGRFHSLALKNDGTVWAWGSNGPGSLGNGTNTNSNVPVQVNGLIGIIAIAGGNHDYSLALKNDGTVRAWGLNNYGQLGNGTNSNSNVPVQVSSLTGVIAIAGGIYHGVALKNDGTVRAWGYNFDGELGNGNNTDSNVPVLVNSLSGIIGIAAGGWHCFALKNDGTVSAWGRNFSGQFGNGTTNGSNVPIQVTALTGVIAIAGGTEYSHALKNDGTVWFWGSNNYGLLGNGTTGGGSTIPLKVTGLCINCSNSTFSQSLSICQGQSVTIGTNTYTTNGTYIDTLETTNGCDSVVTTNLIVNLSYASTVNVTIHSGDSLQVGTHSYDTTGIYIDTLIASNGCDSIVTTNLIVLTGINNIGYQNTKVKVYPNPFSSSATIEISDLRFTKGDLIICDVLGQEVHRQTLNSKKETINLNLPPGIYFYKIDNEKKEFANGKLMIQ